MERIGVAAFCKSGLVTIQFLGIPKVIEEDVFEYCWQLKEIVVFDEVKLVSVNTNTIMVRSLLKGYQ